jgi:amphi-Trp domain-containing protein
MSGPKEVLYKSEEQMSRSDLANLFREIADRIEKGSLTLRSTDKETSVQFPEQLELEIQYEVKQKSGGEKRQLELEISWGAGVGGIQLA